MGIKMKPRALSSLLILDAVFSNCFAVRNGILEVLRIFEDADKTTSSSLNLKIGTHNPPALGRVKDNNWCDPDSCACYFTTQLQMGCICGAIKDKCNPGCNFCICTKSVPPQCQCRDLRDSCPSA